MLLQPGAGGEAGRVGGIKKTKGSPESAKGSNDLEQSRSLEEALMMWTLRHLEMSKI